MRGSVGRRFRSIFGAVGFALISLWASGAVAQGHGSSKAAKSLFFQNVDTDWAHGWLEAIFRGAAMPSGLLDGATNLANLAAAFRDILGIFSLGVLVLAGFLVIYHVVSMIAETAHTGVPMGRRTNQFWAPLRFVLAIGLLVPIGGGLNTGQFAVLKLSEAGSALASSAWRSAVDIMKGSFAGAITPRGPDIPRFVAVAAEMEICRSLYRLVHAGIQPDAVLNRVGVVDEVQKSIAGRLMPETWLYTNTLHRGVPLCGAYRFLAGKSPDNGATNDAEMSLFADEWADFARADTERVIIQTRMLVEQVAPAFLHPSSALPPVNMADGLSALMQEQQQTIEAKLRAIAGAKTTSVDQILDESSSAGWASAGFFLGKIIRRQMVFGEIAAHTIPSVHAPVLGHKALSSAMIAESVLNDAVLRNLASHQLDKVYTLYEQVSLGMRAARLWLYAQQIAGGEVIAVDTLDLADHITSALDSASGSYVFRRLLGNAMATHGVWASSTQKEASRKAHADLLRETANNPIAGLAEIGRRYHALGSYILGMAGPGLAEPGVMGSAVAFAITGVAFALSGLALLFVAPLLPMYRFLLGVLAWLLTVFAAIAVLPLVALAHLYPSGEGLSGPIARQAYWLWLGVFLRPFLTLAGFVMGLVALMFALALLNSLYMPLASMFYVGHGDAFISMRVGMSLFYAVMALALVNVAFKGIEWLPASALRWLNTSGGVFPHSLPVNPAFSGATQVYAASSSGATTHQTKSVIVGARVTGKATTDKAAAETQSHGLKAALMPVYREPSVEAVAIADKDVAGTSVSSGGAAGAQTGAASAKASVSGDKATAAAFASAHATAIVKDRQGNLPDKPTPEDIEKALEKLSKKLDKREQAKTPAEENENGNKEKQTDVSREQTGASSEDENPA